MCMPVLRIFHYGAIQKLQFLNIQYKTLTEISTWKLDFQAEDTEMMWGEWEVKLLLHYILTVHDH